MASSSSKPPRPMASSSSKPSRPPLSDVEELYAQLPKKSEPNIEDLLAHQDLREITIRKPNTPDHYRLVAPIGLSDGGSGRVFRALYLPQDTEFMKDKKKKPQDLLRTLKVINLEAQAQYESLIEKVDDMDQLKTGNILNIEDSFITGDKKFYVAIPFMNEGSLRCLMASCFTNGFPEDLVSIVLAETLRGLDYVHQNGFEHKEISAGHIFYSSHYTPSIKLAVFASIYEQDSSSDQPPTTQSDITICQWAAPPEIYYNKLYDEPSRKSDIWLVGITALELLFGGIRVAGRQELEAMISEIIKKSKNAKKKKLKNKLGAVFKKMKKSLKFKKNKTEEQAEGMTYKYFVPSVMVNDRKMSQAFVDMAGECLKEDIEKRASAGELLQHDFFRNAKDGDYFENAVRVAKGPAEINPWP